MICSSESFLSGPIILIHTDQHLLQLPHPNTTSGLLPSGPQQASFVCDSISPIRCWVIPSIGGFHQPKACKRNKETKKCLQGICLGGDTSTYVADKKNCYPSASFMTPAFANASPMLRRKTYRSLSPSVSMSLLEWSDWKLAFKSSDSSASPSGNLKQWTKENISRHCDIAVGGCFAVGGMLKITLW